MKIRFADRAFIFMKFLRKGELMIMPNTTIHEELKLPPFDERGKFRKRTELLPIQYQAIAELVSGTDKRQFVKIEDFSNGVISLVGQ